MSQPSSSGQQRRGLNPISTTFNSTSANRPPAASNSPSRSSFPPLNSAPTSTAHSTTRQSTSRASSVSSATSPFSPTQGVQQPQPSSLLSSLRARNIPSSNNSQLAPSAAGLPAASQGGVGAAASTGGGATSKLARASPSASQSSGVGSPIVTSNLSSAPSSGQQSLSKIAVAQVFVLISQFDQEKDKAKRDRHAESIAKLIDSHGMEVFSKYFRRLLQNNAQQIFGRGSEPSGSYQLLANEVQKLRLNPEQATAIAESLDTTEGDLFRDFDISTFMEQFKLDAVGKSMLALALKSTSKSDLRTKADAIMTNNFQALLLAIATPNENGDDLPTPYFCTLLDRILQDPPRNWNDENKSHLHQAIAARYERLGTAVPREVQSILHLSELLAPTNTLVRLIQREGPRATSTLENCKSILANAPAGEINYTQVATALLYMVLTQNGPSYNPSTFVAAVRDHRSGKRLDWADVMHAFDREGLVVTKGQFLALYNVLLPLAAEYENVDIQILFGGPWQHLDTELSFVTAFLSCTPEELDASTIPRLRKAFTLDLFDDATDEVREHASKAVRHPLVSLDAVDAIFRIVFASQEAYKQATALGIPEAVINPNTDLFVLSAAALPKPWGPVQDQAFKQLFLPFLKKMIDGYPFVFHGLWKREPRWLASRLVEAYQAAPVTFLPFIFDHAREHGWLEALLQNPSHFSVDLAAYAHSQGALDIEPWLELTFNALPEVFPRALRDFLDEKARSDQSFQRGTDTVLTTTPLAVKTVFAFLNFLQSHLSDEILVDLIKQCIAAYPRVVNYGEDFDDLIDENGRHGNAISAEADASMQEYFKKMYNRECDVREIVEALRRFKTSQDPTEQDLFACMITGLFDEYHCFTEYPQDALATTAVLFGSIINFDLLSSIPLQAALAMVLEAVQSHSSDTKMFKFGLEALSHFRNRLPEWPAFCERLLQVPDLQATEIWPIAADAVHASGGSDPAARGSGDDRGQNGDGGASDHPGLTNGDNADDFLATEPLLPPFDCLHVDAPVRPDIYEAPDEDVQDKVLFILNNVSERNLQDKLKDLKEALEAKHHKWFAEYLVEERAKLQPNFQQLYLDMLANIDDQILWAEVLRETYVSCFRMLNAQQTLESSSERSHLKNLAGWLGSLTLARDQPIKFRNISFRDLLIQAYRTARLIIVVPFTCKVLVQAARSKVFKPPNPWTMEIIRILVELYDWPQADMKLNQKFEVEVLCKDLDVDIEEARRIESTVIRDSVARAPPEPDYLHAPGIPDGLDGFGDLTVSINRSRSVNDRFSHASIMAQIPELSSRISFPSFNQLSSSSEAEQLRSVFLQAATMAIKEIIYPVVERSVTIAAIATNQLLTKDYATEPDVDKFRKAAQSMVESLAGSLADVTCKEPVKMSMTNNLRILARETLSDTLPEGVIIMFVNDNLDMACKVVQQAAEEAALQEIENLIQDGIRARQAHQNLHSDESFQWPGVSKYAYFIPEPYRPSTYVGLKPEQLAIYENFKVVRAFTGHMQTPSGGEVPDPMIRDITSMTPLPQGHDLGGVRQGPGQQPSVGRLQGMPGMPSQLNGFADGYGLSDRADQLLVDMLRCTKDEHAEHFDDLALTGPTRDVLEQLLHLVETSGANLDALCMHLAQRAFAALFSEDLPRLGVEIVSQLLATLSASSLNAGRVVNQWIAGIDDERLFYPIVTPCLIRTRLLAPHRLDSALCKAFVQRNQRALEFLNDALEELLTMQPPLLRTNIARALEALSFWVQEKPDLELGQAILKRAAITSVDTNDSVVDGSKEEYFETIFESWVSLSRPDTSPKAVAKFVQQLHQQGVLKDSESVALFLRTCLEGCLAGYDREVLSQLGRAPHPEAGLEAAYTSVDALASLVVALVIFQGEADGAVKSNKVATLDSLLSLIVFIQVHHQRSRGDQMNSKVFFRFYSTILAELNKVVDSFLAGFKNHIYQAVAKAFMALQPTFFPGFSFAWAALISHRFFMPHMLHDITGWDSYATIIESLLAYTGDSVKPQDVPAAGQLFARSTFRILLVLHHDFPDFLVEYHVKLVNALPSHCLQMRNLILSASPSAITDLPDPFHKDLKVERIDEVRRAPEIRGQVFEPLKEYGVEKLLENILRTMEYNSEEIAELAAALCASNRKDTGYEYLPITANVPLISAVVVAIGIQAVNASKGNYSNFGFFIKLLHTILGDLTPDGSYYFIGSIADQLRFPSSHTYFFTRALPEMFGQFGGDLRADEIKEQIVRVLTERLLTQRPHPWGVIITLVELYRNPNYQFADMQFIKSSPDIRPVMLSILQSIWDQARRDWRSGSRDTF